ncbi:MAG: hypothetical protein NVSMB45_15030 [Ginsengibacter sp.]
MTANELTQYTLKVLKMSGFEVWRNNAIPVRGRTFIGRKGVSDIIGFCKQTGKFIGVEIKVGKDTLKPEQTDFLTTLAISRGHAFIIKTPEQIDQIIKLLNNASTTI